MSAEEGRAGDVMEQRNVQAASPVGREEGGRRTMHGRTTGRNRREVVVAAAGSDTCEDVCGGRRRTRALGQ